MNLNYEVNTKVNGDIKVEYFNRKVIPLETIQGEVRGEVRLMGVSINFKDIYFDSLIKAEDFYYTEFEDEADNIDDFNKYWELVDNIDHVPIHNSKENGLIRIKDIKDGKMKNKILETIKSELANILI